MMLSPRALFGIAVFASLGALRVWSGTSPVASPPASQSANQVAMQGAVNWLVGQQVRETGLLASFARTSDVCLVEQASTYDQAIAGIALCATGNCDMARRILEFFRARWTAQPGLPNFVSAANGRDGVETRRQAGVNLWVALLALNYGTLTGNTEFEPLALEIARWVAGHPHVWGGPTSGRFFDGTTHWDSIVATEHVIDYYAVTNSLAARASARDQAWLAAERAGAIRFLRERAWDRARRTMNRGDTHGRIDSNQVLDVYTWLVAAVTPRELRAWGIDPIALMATADSLFRVTVDGVTGYDFTDAQGARLVGRSRTVSVEWTGGAIVAHRLIANDLRDNPNGIRIAADAEGHAQLAERLIGNVDRLALVDGGRMGYPYATVARESVFTAGWKTPSLATDGRLSGSVAGTAWRIFSAGYNPLNPSRPWIGTPFPRVVPRSTPRSLDGAMYQPSTTCTSAGLVDAAWVNFGAGRMNVAFDFAWRTVTEYAARAFRFADSVKGTGLIPHTDGDDAAAMRIHRRAPMNDVGAALYIAGRAALTTTPPRREEASRAFRLLIDSARNAQSYDSRMRTFWSPASAVMREYPALVGADTRTPSQRLAQGDPVWVWREYDDQATAFAPSGWMGDYQNLRLDPGASPAEGRHAMAITWTPPLNAVGAGWVAVAFQYPASNWGDKPEGLDLTGAQRLVFMARGAIGGEEVEFKVGGGEGRYAESLRPARGSGVVRLTDRWQRFEIPLPSGSSMRHIITGFVVAINQPGFNAKRTTVLVDEIRFEGGASR